MNEILQWIFIGIPYIFMGICLYLMFKPLGGR